MPARSLSIGNYQLPDEMIQSGAQIVEDFSKYDGPFDRSIRRLSTIYPNLLVDILTALL